MWPIDEWPSKRQSSCTNILMKWNQTLSSTLVWSDRHRTLSKWTPRNCSCPRFSRPSWEQEPWLSPKHLLHRWNKPLWRGRAKTQVFIRFKILGWKTRCSTVRAQGSTTTNRRYKWRKFQDPGPTRALRSKHSRIRETRQLSYRATACSRILRRGWTIWRVTGGIRNTRIGWVLVSTRSSSPSCGRHLTRRCLWGTLCELID